MIGLKKVVDQIGNKKGPENPTRETIARCHISSHNRRANPILSLTTANLDTGTDTRTLHGSARRENSETSNAPQGVGGTTLHPDRIGVANMNQERIMMLRRIPLAGDNPQALRRKR